MTKPTDNIRSVVRNRKARYDYELFDTVEAGIALVGSEVKALRIGRCNITESYASIERGECWLYNLHIGEYPQANRQGHVAMRKRKLLLARHEIDSLQGKIRETGYSLIPVEVYFRGSYAKVKLAVARGKKQYDKRESLKAKTHKREMDR